jgi:hypothetical protein
MSTATLNLGGPEGAWLVITAAAVHAKTMIDVLVGTMARTQCTSIQWAGSAVAFCRDARPEVRSPSLKEVAAAELLRTNPLSAFIEGAFLVVVGPSLSSGVQSDVATRPT